MKFIVCFLLGISLLFACGGSCVECHPKLKHLLEDKQHNVLTQCITCHSKPSNYGACGQDCFSCHDKTKLYADAAVKEHQAVRKCYECHKDTSSFLGSKKSISSQQQLVDFLKK